MKDGGGDYGRVERLLAEAGVRMPPVPEVLRRQLKERDDWYYSTRTFKAPPLELLHYVRKAIAGALPDFALIARQADPRILALHFYLIQAPLQLFLQLRWADLPAALAAIDGALELSEQLVREMPAALRRGRLTPDGRITVVASDLTEGFWEVAAGTERATRPGAKRARSRAVPAPVETLADALRWCRG